ncbi:8980_t:CDS:2 [Cetraspora pellucida]|uniref:8980_t:CDS:1 n=1 Tax=Cetraspora pellucida TaxID=1433469 RepID=A0A9N9NK31_9GLOM|nr:8980_t:CDS:2 [Cetraspora pellucida]
MLHRMAGDNSINKEVLLLLAPIGVTAFNIQGSTIYSALFILIAGTNYNLEGNCLKTLQSKLQNIRYVIQAFPYNNNIPFGSLFVILVGDFGQLSPVCDLLMYLKDLHQSDSLSENRLYKFEVVEQQAGDLDEQCQFRDLLLCLCNSSSEAVNTDLKTAKGLESEILLAKKACVMFTTNICVFSGLVNGAMGTIEDILFERSNQLLVLVAFDKYYASTITNVDKN